MPSADQPALTGVDIWRRAIVGLLLPGQATFASLNLACPMPPMASATGPCSRSRANKSSQRRSAPSGIHPLGWRCRLRSPESLTQREESHQRPNTTSAQFAPAGRVKPTNMPSPNQISRDAIVGFGPGPTPQSRAENGGLTIVQPILHSQHSSYPHTGRPVCPREGVVAPWFPWPPGLPHPKGPRCAQGLGLRPARAAVRQARRIRSLWTP